jgi:hypothetical protein
VNEAGGREQKRIGIWRRPAKFSADVTSEALCVAFRKRTGTGHDRADIAGKFRRNPQQQPSRIATSSSVRR